MRLYPSIPSFYYRCQCLSSIKKRRDMKNKNYNTELSQRKSKLKIFHPKSKINSSKVTKQQRVRYL